MNANMQTPAAKSEDRDMRLTEKWTSPTAHKTLYTIQFLSPRKPPNSRDKPKIQQNIPRIANHEGRRRLTATQPTHQSKTKTGKRSEIKNTIPHPVNSPEDP